MKINEVFQYAKDRKIDDLKFVFTNEKNKLIVCKVLDPHLELFEIEGSQGFITGVKWKVWTKDLIDFNILGDEMKNKTMKLKYNNTYDKCEIGSMVAFLNEFNELVIGIKTGKNDILVDGLNKKTGEFHKVVQIFEIEDK